MTDAAILSSFVLVTASLSCFACRGRVTSGRWRSLDMALPVVAVAMCGGLLLHVSAWHLMLTGILAAAGLGVSRWSWSGPGADDDRAR
jgi:hypothetical protein